MSSFFPSKSQPLHNFALPPLLRWKKDAKSGESYKRRRSMKSPSLQRSDAASTSPPRYSPLRDYVTPASPPVQKYLAPPSPESPVVGGYSAEEAPVYERMKHLAVGGDSEKLSFLREEALRYSPSGDRSSESRKGEGAVIGHYRNPFKKSEIGAMTKAVCSSNPEERKLERKCKAADGDTAGIKKRSNVPIKIAYKHSKEVEEKTVFNNKHGKEEKEGKTTNNSDEDIKLWNLRPRNVKTKLDNAKVGGEKGDVSGKSKSLPQLRSCIDKSSGKEGKSGGEKEKSGKLEDKEKAEKREKKRLSINIALTKEEIEEDIFALTTSKPSRRPKRRPKNVQKQLDSTFPGLWLVSITPESYKVSESSLKG